jgi:hypothetical protein
MSNPLPNVSTKVSNNPNIISNQAGLRLPAYVGLGPTTITYTDEAVIRGSGAVDNLSVYPSSGSSLIQVASITGVTVGAPNAVLTSKGGQLYQIASASLSPAGQITWNTGSVTDIPGYGVTYYVTYNSNVPALQYNPQTSSTKEQLQALYGNENNQTGILTIAGSVGLENGSPQVITIQASGSSFNMFAYQAAIDQLQKLNNIEQIVCVFPSGSVTAAQQQQLITYAFSHTQYMNNIGKNRGIMSGSPSPAYAADGFDTIGFASQAGTYLNRAAALMSTDSIYVVPSTIQRYDQSGNLIQLDGNFGAAAIAGLQAAQSLRSTPLDGFVVAGLVIEDNKWLPAEEQQLSDGNCTILVSNAGVVTILQYITGDPTSADTQEPSVRAVQRLVIRTLNTGLFNAYMNKGLTIQPETILDVIATTNSLLQGLVTSKEIVAYGKNNNPITGEVATSAIQDATNPLKIDVTASYAPAYPLKFISVTVSVFLSA